jgi:hypothetical protein
MPDNSLQSLPSGTAQIEHNRSLSGGEDKTARAYRCRLTDDLSQIAARHGYQNIGINWDRKPDASDLSHVERMPMFTDFVIAPAHPRVLIDVGRYGNDG